MSYITDRYNLEGAVFGEITITNCGITENHPSHTSGKRIYHDYSLHFITEGTGRLICDGKEYQLSKGEGFLIIPGVANEYIGDAVAPWKYVYVGFLGGGAEKLLSDAGLSREKCVFSYPEEALPDIFAMHRSGKNRANKGYGVLGYMLAIMSRLIANENTGAIPLWSPENYVTEAKRFILNNYAYDITVENVADYVGLDRTYLYRLFQKYEHCSPSKYIWNVRLDESVKKLRDEDTSISNIAMSSGFGDVSHFYKAFTAKYKISPKKFREGKK